MILRCAQLLVAAVLVLGFADPVDAGSLSFAWDPSPGDVAGYVVRCGLNPGLYTHTAVVGNTTSATVYGLSGGQTYYCTVSAYGTNGLSAPSNVVTAATTNVPPQFASSGNQQNAEGDFVGRHFSATDADYDSLVYTATGLPDGLSINNSTGFVSGWVSYSAAGTHNITITVTDGAQSTSSNFSWVVTATNRGPVLPLLSNRSSPIGASVTFQLPAFDPDGDALTFAAPGLPAGLSLNTTTGIITGSPTSVGTSVVSVSVFDVTAGSMTVNRTFTWVVLGSNSPAVFTAPAVQLNGLSSFAQVQLQGSDPDGNTLTYVAVGLPPELQLDGTTGIVTGIPTTAGTYTVTVTVTDGVTSDTKTFPWTIITDRAPSIQNPLNRTRSEGGTVILGLEAFDPDGDVLTYYASGLPPGLALNGSTGVVTGIATLRGTYLVTVSVSDGPLSDSATFTWTIVENRPPQIESPGNQSFNEGAVLSLILFATDPDDDPLTYSASGLPPGATFDNVYFNILGQLTPTSSGIYTVTLTASDGRLSDTETFEMTVGNVDRPPVFTTVPAQTSAENTSVSLQLTATDPDGEVVSFTATGLPPGLTLNATTGLISGPLSYTSAGVYPVTATATSGTMSRNKSFAWTVTNVNRPPTLATFPNQSHAENATVTRTFVGADLDGEPLTYSLSTVPDGLVLTATTGVLTGKLSFNSAGNYTIVASVSDGTATATQTFTWTITQVNRSPALSSILNQSNPEYTVIALQLTAVDPDGDPVTYSITGLPAGLTLNSATGLVSGTLTGTSSGSYNVTATANDGSLSHNKSFVWTVANVTNRAPVLNTPPQTHAENTTVSVALVATDPDGDSVTFGATGLPPGLTLNTATGVVTGNLSFTSAGTYAVVSTASDGSLTQSQTFTWTITNVNRAPSLAAIANQAHEESQIVSLQMSATDPDGGALTYSATGLPTDLNIHPATGLISGTLSSASAGTHTVVVTVSDGWLSHSQTFTWTVTDVNRAPVLTAVPAQTHAEGANVSVALSATDLDGDPLTYTATGLPPALTLNPTTGLITGVLPFTGEGTYSVTATVSDGVLTHSQAFTWTVTNVNRAPVLSSPGAQTHAENANVSLSLNATDPDGDTLTYSATAVPDGLTLNTSSGVVSGTLTFASAGVHTVTVSASDGALAHSQTFTWTVTNVNRAPVVTPVTNRTDTEGAAISVTFFAADPDGDALTFSVPGLPAGVSLNSATGVVTGNLSFTSGGTYPLTVTASDGTLTHSQSFAWTVANANGAPVLTAIPPPTHAENTTVTLALSASDPDGDAITFGASGLPPGLTINATTGAITGSLSFTSAGVYTTTATATAAGQSHSQTFAWTITNVNRPPVLAAFPNQSHAENATVTRTFVGTDVDGDPLTYSLSTVPDGLALNAATGVLTGKLSFNSAGTYTIVATVSDGTATHSQTFTWVITNVNRAPALSSIVNQSNPEHTVIALQLSATDPDGDPVTYSITALPAGLTLNTATGLISGKLTSTSSGSYNMTATANDGSLTHNKSFVWTVANVPNRAPVLTAVPAQTHTEGAVVSLALVASDLDDDPFAFTANVLPPGLSLNASTGVISGTVSFTGTRTYTVTATVSDGVLAHSQTFTWVVNRAPSLSAVPPQSGFINATVSLPLVATDPDGDPLSYSATGLPAGLIVNAATGVISGTLTTAGDSTIIATVTDGLVTRSQTFTWTVIDGNRPPVLSAVPNSTHDEGTNPSIALVASDPDGDGLTFSAAGLPPGFSVNPATGIISGTLSFTSAGSYPVTASVSDGSVTHSQTFTWTITNVNRAPVLTTIANQAHLENASVSLPLSASDLDGDALTYSAAGLPVDLTVNASSGVINGTLTFASAGVHPVTVTVSDGTLTHTQTFTWTVTNVNRVPALPVVPDRTDPEGASVSLSLGATDPDGDAVTYSASGLPPGVSLDVATGVLSGTFSFTSAGTYAVTVGASDGTLSQSRTLTWTVSDVNRPPVLTTVPSPTDAENTTVSLPLTASDPDGDSITFSATGLPPGLTINATTGTITGSLSFASAGIYTTTVTVSAGTLSQSYPFTWTITNVNRPPVLAAFPNQSHAENATVTRTLVGTDVDGDPLTYSMSVVPDGLILNAATGVITGKLSFTSAGNYTIVATVSDGTATHSQTFTWVVTQVNRSPALSSILNQSNPELTVIALQLSATDPDGDPVTYSITGLPAGLSLNGTTGLISGKLTSTSSGSYNVTATASDGSLTHNKSFVWTVANVPNRAPVLTAVPSKSHTEGDVVSLALVASDPDDDPLTFSASTLPAGLSLNPSTGVIGGTLSSSSAGSYTVTATVSDGLLTHSQSFAWTVLDGNHAPSFNPSSQTHGEGAVVSFAFTAVDPEGDPVTFTASGLPPGLGIDPATGIISGTLSFTSAGTYPVTATASDGVLMQSRSFTWTVTNVNRAPVLAAIANQAHAENTVVSLTLGGSDLDGDLLTYSATGLPTDLSINAATGVISGTLSFTSAGGHTVVATVSDGTASHSQTFTWTITNVNRAPVFPSVTGTTFDEGAIVALSLGATDPDADALTYSATGLPAGLNLNVTTGVVTGTLSFTSAGTYPVTANVSDGTLSASQSFTVTVTDVNRPPVLTTVPPPTHAENTSATLALSATDPDGETVTFSASGLPPGLSINATTGAITGSLSFSSAGSYTTTVTATAGALSSSQTFTWTITNVNRPPTLAAFPNQSHAENATVTRTFVGSDPDAEPLTYSMSVVPDGLILNAATGVLTGKLSFNSAGTYSITATVSDGTATASQTFTWTVTQVNRSPALSSIPNQSNPEHTVIALQLSATDPDGDLVTYSIVGLPPGLTLNTATGLISGKLTGTSSGSHNVTATAHDGSLTHNKSFVWTVANVLNRAPVLTAVPAQTHAENDTVSLALAATDLDDDVLTFSATGLPTDLTFTSTTGVISGTLSYTSAGSYTVTATVSDGVLTHSRTFSWTITDVEEPEEEEPGLSSSDLDADGKTDLVVYDPVTGEWSVRYSAQNFEESTAGLFQLGAAGDVPLVGDFDGDHKADLTVYRPSTGQWLIRYSTEGYNPAVEGVYESGQPGDVPLAGDFDGDGSTDLTVYRPSTGQWIIRYSSQDYSTETSGTFQWGIAGDTPLVGDFDGDGKVDLTIYRPSTGEWFVRYSSQGYSTGSAGAFQWGQSGDTPLTGDFDGDDKTELTFYRPSTGEWFIGYSTLGYATSGGPFQWGVGADVPLIADFDGDGKAEVAVYRPSTGEWSIRYSAQGYSAATFGLFHWGQAGDVPVTK